MNAAAVRSWASGASRRGSDVSRRMLPGLWGLSASDVRLLSKVRDERLTYLSERKLMGILRACRQIERDNLAGDFVEAGCALGGSAIVIAATKRCGRPLRVYDVFGMIPPPSVQDGEDVEARHADIVAGASPGIGDDRYHGYQEDLRQTVERNLARYGHGAHTNVAQVQGLLQETLNVEAPIAFAHIDVDWYEPVKVCLDRLGDRLVVGGSIVIDDYFDWSGCRQATDEYLSSTSWRYAIDDSAGSRKLIRIA